MLSSAVWITRGQMAVSLMQAVGQDMRLVVSYSPVLLLVYNIASLFGWWSCGLWSYCIIRHAIWLFSNNITSLWLLTKQTWHWERRQKQTFSVRGCVMHAFCEWLYVYGHVFFCFFFKTSSMVSLSCLCVPQLSVLNSVVIGLAAVCCLITLPLFAWLSCLFCCISNA